MKMKILLLSTLTVALLLLVCSTSSLVVADKPQPRQQQQRQQQQQQQQPTGGSSREENTNNNNNNNNIFNPVSAIVTKNGGAIVTMKATLNPPIKTEGYHEVSVAWCNRQQWFDCLASSNKTSECRCNAPGTDVEESVRFNLDGDGDDEDESSNSNTRTSSSSCTVVSQRWEQDQDYEAHFKKFREEMKLKIDKESRLAQTYRNRMNIINEKFVNFNKKENVSDVEEFIKKISRLEDERALMGEKIDECNRRIEEWRKASIRPGTENLARIMKLELFCASSSTANTKPIVNFSELTAQATFAKARWEPSHILLIDTSDENENNNEKKKDTNYASSASEVRMAAKLSHETHCDWKDVKVSLRQGAPGEDTTTTQDPPNDSPLEPWVLTVRDHAPPRTATNNLFNQNDLLRQRQQKFSKSKSGAKRHKRSASRRADESATASFSAPVGSGMDEILMDIEEEGVFAEDESFGGGEPATDLTQDPASGTEIVGSFTEETKLPHRVSVPKNSHSIVEIGRGAVTSSMHRVAAAYRCRSHATSSSSICSLPVFLRANVTNTNKFSILGGPTRVIVDGVPFNPFGRARTIQNNNINSNMFQQNQFQQQQQQSMQPTFSSSSKSASFRPAIAPESWGWVDLGEDTRVTIQRYEKSNIMSASQAQQGKGWWEKMIANEEEKNFVAVKFEMKVTNTRKTPVTIDLRDQFPRTNSDEIEIKLDGETLKNKFLAVKSLPTATDNNNDGDSASSNTDKPSSCSYRHPTDKTKCISTRNGGEELQWNVEVGPSGTVVIPFGFTVTWPKKKFVHGLA